MHDTLLGTRLGQYLLVDRLGAGGMGVVYRAYQPALDRYVAIKILPPPLGADPLLAERFRTEARAVARLEHPNILPVYDVGVSYIVMPFVTGGTLKSRLGQPLPVDWTVAVGVQLASALAHAHSRAVVHRDVKPANVLLGPDERPLLADFGIARLLDGAGRLTRTGVGVGTPEYMSPEQCQGQPVDGRSDLYGLGAILFEMLAGSPPFHGASPAEVLLQQITGAIPSVRASNPAVPAALDRVLGQALAKLPEHRFATGHDLARALHEALPGTASPPHPPPPQPYEIALPLHRSDALEMEEAPAGVGRLGATVEPSRHALPAASTRTAAPVRTRATLALAAILLLTLGALVLRGLPRAASPAYDTPGGTTNPAAPITAAPDPTQDAGLPGQPVAASSTPLPLACREPEGALAEADMALLSGDVERSYEATRSLSTCPEVDGGPLSGRLAALETLRAALVAREASDWNGAVELVRQVAAQEPMLPGVDAVLADMLLSAGLASLRAGTADDALRQCREAHALRPEDAEIERCLRDAQPPTREAAPPAPSPPPARAPTRPPTVAPSMPTAVPTATRLPPQTRVRPPTATLLPPPPRAQGG